MNNPKNKCSLLLLFLQIIFCLQVFSVSSDKKALSERITGYNINATLNPVSKTVTATMDAFWVNKSPDTVPDIRMHLFMNAFRDGQSTMYKELGGSPGQRSEDRGWINLLSFSGKDGTDYLPWVKYISPDDNNPADMTVIQVTLPQPAYPGDTLFINITFETKLPSFGDYFSGNKRSGYSRDYFFVAQWFPKFGVYEPAGMRYSIKGGWNCHQFHATSEFYSNHSVYNVKITLPDTYITGSCGIKIDESNDGNGNKTQTFRAEDIVDFAWTAWPGFATITEKWRDVNITLLIPEENIGNAGRQMKAVKYGLEYFTEKVGPYPWNHLTFIDPPRHGNSSGGMEYSTLFTSSSSELVPPFIHIPEVTTIHELGHAWFMGIMASNEFEEPWLDEGINTFWEGRVADSFFGNNSGYFYTRLLQQSGENYIRTRYTGSPLRQIATNKCFSWDYPHDTYYMMSYFKAGTILQTLMGIVGEETMTGIFREYYRKWAFRHPSGSDFISVVNEVVAERHGNEFGADMNWFFDQTIFGTGICDYKASGFTNRRKDTDLANSDSSNPGTSDLNSRSLSFISTASVVRLGDIVLPVEVLIHFNNGDEILEKWDGMNRFKDFVYEGERKITWIKVDPGYKITMDVNYINNSLTDNTENLPLRRIFVKIIFLMQTFLSIALL